MRCDDLAILEEQVGEVVSNSVNPGFPYGRSGSVGPSPAWYLNNEVASNKVGLPFGLNNGIILSIWVGSEDLNTYTLEVYEHEGNEVNLTLLASVNVTATRTAIILPTDPNFTSVNNPSFGKQIAVRLASGTAKNPKASIFMGGTA